MASDIVILYAWSDWISVLVYLCFIRKINNKFSHLCFKKKRRAKWVLAVYTLKDMNQLLFFFSIPPKYNHVLSASDSVNFGLDLPPFILLFHPLDQDLDLLEITDWQLMGFLSNNSNSIVPCPITVSYLSYKLPCKAFILYLPLIRSVNKLHQILSDHSLPV